MSAIQSAPSQLLMNMFLEGDQLIASEFEDNCSETVTFQRGQATLSLSAVIGTSVFEQLGTEGSVMIRTETTDFVITSANLIISGSVIEPRRGDKFIRTIGSKTVEYQVTAPDPEPLFRYCGQSRLQMRVHTVKAREL